MNIPYHSRARRSPNMAVVRDAPRASVLLQAVGVLKCHTCLCTLDDLIDAETQKLEALKTHKRGLMQQLFPSPEEVEA